jgi:hypothetical protein
VEVVTVEEGSRRRLASMASCGTPTGLEDGTLGSDGGARSRLELVMEGTVAALGGQGSGDGEHEEENAKRESSALCSQKIKASTRWPVHVGSETTGSQSETAAINNRGSRGLKKEARCGDADEWAPPGLDIF